MSKPAAVAALLMFLVLAPAVPAGAVEYTGSQYRDPFFGETNKVSIQDEIVGLSLTLEGIVWNSTKPQAIINGKIVSAGQTVEQAEVLDIKKDGVKMRYKQQVFVLRRKG